MNIKITLCIGLLAFGHAVYSQSITTKEVEVLDVNETTVDGPTIFRDGEVTIEGNTTNGGGVLKLQSDFPKLRFHDSNKNQNYDVIVDDGEFLIQAIDDTGTYLGPSMAMFVGGGTWFAGGLTVINGFTAVPTGNTVSINSVGTLVIDKSHHVIDTYQSAASSNLRNINFAGDPVDGAIIYLRTLNGSRDVVIKHNDGNIRVNDGGDLTLNTNSKIVMLMYMQNLSRWVVINAW